MAITKMSNSGIASTGSEKYNDMLAGNPPYIPSDFESIATVTVGASTTPSVTFSSIPQTYKHLQLRYFGGYSGSPGASGSLSFNGDTTSTNYYDHAFYGSGASVASAANADSRLLPYNLGDVNQWGVNITDILDYTNTNKLKTIRGVSGWDGNGGGAGNTYFLSALPVTRPGTGAVTSLTIVCNGNIATTSSVALYGIKG